ncbi:cation/multidrug efflux pump [Methylophaga lonarensis MPL]|uniref:Cation/multidrug efflux pump n=1 Tax=Methylophaga lonarensis MPL TaxID=1286106 RepID=M7NZV5_9GAMM|nr:efflux RND transporter permease subunit [Methylophaga lonarensis]EMR12751.1 cation/multidrug efflux pump [Methylophaga lonarensis MPL]
MNNLSSRRGIIPWFASNPVAANLLLILVIMLGVLEMGNLRREAFPSREPDSISISVSYDSGSAQQSEEGLAIKIEDQLEDVTGIRSITSSSTRSGVSISVEMQSGYDLDELLRDVKNQIDAISTFPAEAKRPVISKAEREEHALWLQLYGNSNRHTMQQLAEELKSDLMAHEKINRVSISGWLDPMMFIEIDEGQLQAYGLSLSDVETAINASSSDTMTAVLRNESLFLQLRASQQAYLQQDFADIPLVTTPRGQQIRLGDVATIRDDYDDDTSVLSRFQGQESIALQVITTGMDDISDTVDGARQVVDNWVHSGKLPQGVELASWYDRSVSINQRLDLLIKNALTGIALVFLLLALFLNLTVAFWVAMGLPFVFFGTLYFMGDSYAGLTLNSFTTFGFILALGIIVDDAVVVGESIYSVRSKEGDTLRNTIKGTMRVAVPTLFGVFTTVVAFYALSHIEGRLGSLYAQFAAVVSIALMLSIVESKLILPAHLAHLNTQRRTSHHPLVAGWKKIQNGADSSLQWFASRIYRPVIDIALRQRYAVVIMFIAIFALVIAMPASGKIRISFFPGIPGDTVTANLNMQNDISFGQTHQTLLMIEARAYRADQQLREDTEHQHSGIANLQLLSTADQSGSLVVELTPDAPYDLQQFSQTWQRLIGQPEGVRTLNVRSTRRMADALRIELRSNDDEVLTRAGQQLRQLLLQTPAIQGLEDTLDPSQPQIQLRLNAQGLAMGLTTDMLASQILQAFSGRVVQRFQRNSDEIEVRVRYPEADRQNPADVVNARIRLLDGSVVPLSSVATIDYGFTRDRITRINGQRAVYLTADVDKDLQSATELVSQLRRQVVPDLLAQYPGLNIHFAGEAEEQAETQSSMVTVFMVASLVIYILLAVPLKSYIQPVIIMTAIPFGIVGAILGHWMNDLSLSILSLNGIIALSGVVVNDSLLLVSRFNDLKAQGANLHQAISMAARDRLRAVLLTSFTTFAGLLPLLSETSRQAQFLIPAAVSLGYGIMFATVITLILIPCLLMIQLDVARLFKPQSLSGSPVQRGSV